MRLARLLLLLPVSLLLAAQAAAQGVQNMDIAILFGPSPSSSQTVSATIPSGISTLSLQTLGGSVNSGAGFTCMLAYGYQVHSFAAGDLYLDMPLAWKFAGSTTVSQGTVFALSGGRFFWTPGVRFKFNPHPRVSIYVVGGGGLGSIDNYGAQIVNGGLWVTEERKQQLVGEFGAGLDFRLTKLLSLRLEDREFARPGHQDRIFGAGFAVHF